MVVPGRNYGVTYDTLGCPNGMTQGKTSEPSSVSYIPASQMTNVCCVGNCDARTNNSWNCWE